MLHNVYRYDEQRTNEVNLPPPLNKLINSANLGRLTATTLPYMPKSQLRLVSRILA